MKRVKIAVIGVGGISECHIAGYRNDPRAELYAFCDIDAEKLKMKGEKYGITRLYTDVNQMLAELPEIDAVSVCTWNAAHAPCTLAALKAGKHVLCEKPMAMDVAEAKAMEQAAKDAGKLLMIGFVRRFGNDCAVLKDWIDKGSLGDIYYAKATYLRRNGNPGRWFGDKSRSGGGPLIDLGVHVIDLCRYLMGNHQPVSVYGATFKKLADRPEIRTVAPNLEEPAKGEICDVEDLASVMIRFDNGAVLSIEASFSLNIKKDEGTIQLFGTKGGAKLDPELEIYSQQNGYLTNTTLDMSTALSFNGLFEHEISHYLDCVTGEAACRAPAPDGVTLMRILRAAYESAETGHEVVLQ